MTTKQKIIEIYRVWSQIDLCNAKHEAMSNRFNDLQFELLLEMPYFSFRRMFNIDGGPLI